MEKHYQNLFQFIYHPDHLGSSNFVTDPEGNEFEHMEYTPYGESWVDEGTNKNVIGYRFTSKELDTETGLYYFGARYLDPLTSRWMSPDPAFEKYLPERPVDDEARERNRQLPGMGGVYNPVNLSLYCYGVNNPILYVDPNGEKVYVYSMPVVFGHRHLFIVVKNDDIFTSIGLYPTSTLEGAVTGIPGIKGKTTPEIKRDLTSELGEVKKLLAGKKSNVKLEAEIIVPEGMTEKEFDKKVLESVQKYPLKERKYDSTEGPNSNTFVDDVIEKAGGIMPDVEGATQQNWGENKNK